MYSTYIVFSGLHAPRKREITRRELIMKCTKMLAMLLALAMVLAMGSFALAEETIKIGMIGPLTGGAASYGTSVAQGAQIAVDEINALGGMQI